MNRAIIAIILLLTLSLTTKAQTEKGRWLLGAQVADLSYRKYKNDVGYNYSARLVPSINYFVYDNLLIGLDVPGHIEGGQSELPQTGKSEAMERQLGIGPSIRYFLGKSSFRPFIRVGYTYSRYIRKYKQGTTANYRSKGFRSNLAPSIGMAYFVNRHVVLNAGLSYNFYQDKWKNQFAAGSNQDDSIQNSKSKSLSMEIGFALLLGN